MVFFGYAKRSTFLITPIGIATKDFIPVELPDIKPYRIDPLFILLTVLFHVFNINPSVS
jgi:hypothetical protein